MTDHERDLTTCPDCGQPYVRAWATLGGIESLQVGDDDREHTDAVVMFGEGHDPCPARRAPAVGGVLPSDIWHPRRVWAEEEQVKSSDEPWLPRPLRIAREARLSTPEERARHAAVCRKVWEKFGGDPNGIEQEGGQP